MDFEELIKYRIQQDEGKDNFHKYLTFTIFGMYLELGPIEIDLIPMLDGVPEADTCSNPEKYDQ